MRVAASRNGVTSKLLTSAARAVESFTEERADNALDFSANPNLQRRNPVNKEIDPLNPPAGSRQEDLSEMMKFITELGEICEDTPTSLFQAVEHRVAVERPDLVLHQGLGEELIPVSHL